MVDWHTEVREVDVAIVGGGVAGLAAGIAVRENAPSCRVLIIEKAHPERSGCLAAGVNAINAYLHPPETPETFLEFVREEFSGIVRGDLVLSMAAELNRAVDRLAAWGVPFPRDAAGCYLRRGRHAVVVHGERLKPILYGVARRAGVEFLNRTAAVDLMVQEGRVVGLYALGVRERVGYVIRARAVICATGGAAGLYPPVNRGPARGKSWYPPFNAGAGYAMGLRAGAEMTSLEARFIALRVKDTLAPTGTIAQGVKAPQVNARGEAYLGQGYRTAAERLKTTFREEEAGRGPCYLDTTHLSLVEARRLEEAYLEMCPGMVLWWGDREQAPWERPLEICASEPYLVGGHSLSGYWIDSRRRTTLPGLYAAGDVAGGAPKKYVSGCLVEGEIAALTALEDIGSEAGGPPMATDVQETCRQLMAPLTRTQGLTAGELEARLYKILDAYAGGAGQGYRLMEGRLKVAREELQKLRQACGRLVAADPYQLMLVHQAADRVLVAAAMVEHLLYRQETRWPAYQERVDFPRRDDGRWQVFVNSLYDREKDTFIICERPVEGGEPR